MKRIIVSAIGLAIACLATAQAPFTIVRPADGAKVRETVHILFPKNSVPSSGYIGIYVDGKFVEAVMPAESGDYLDYALNTKKRGLKDGKVRIKAVLFGEGGDRPRRIDESEIEVEVANSSSIAIPEDGLKLRYNFRAGTANIYRLEQKIAVSHITEAQAKRGGRPSELPAESEKLRLLYATDTTYGNGDGLVRIQALPPKDKDFIQFTSEFEGSQRRYYDYMMHSVYMKLASTGKELFSVVPTYFPMDGTAGEPSRTDLFAIFPLPVFPTKAIKPGDTWQGSFQIPNLDFDKRDETKSVVLKAPARGDFVGVEWEMGHPCAKIRHSFELGMQGDNGANFMQKLTGVASQKIEETIWFALDKGMAIKVLREYTVDRKTDAPQNQGPASGGGFNGRPGMMGPGDDGGTGGGGGGAGRDLAQGPAKGPPGVQGQGGPSRGGGLQGGPAGAGGGGQGNGGGGATAEKVIQRITVQQVLILEQ